ncbi:MAG: DUF1016 N-terminal domain-containing protein [Segatella copri]
MAVAINTELLRLYWRMGADICEKQKQYKWGAKVVDRLSLDMRSEFPQSEGFSRTNLYDIKKVVYILFKPDRNSPPSW